MKRLIISSENILGMSFPRKEALFKMESLSEEINEHIIQCVVYKELRYLTIDHWVGELATWMNRVNKIKCSSKLKKRDYLDTAFGSVGDSLIDADVNIDAYKLKNQKKTKDEQYPDFEITDELLKKLYDKYVEVIEISLPILMSKEILSIPQWKEILLPIFI